MHAIPFKQGLALAFLLPTLALEASAASMAAPASPQAQQQAGGSFRRADMANTGRSIVGGFPCTHQNRAGCGSLLVFPEYDNTDTGAEHTLATVTHAACANQGSVFVEFVFINSVTCLEANRTEPLTPFDSFTFLTKFFSGTTSRGFFYAFAKSTQNPPNANPIVFNSLIGMETIISGITTFDYSLNAISFRGLGAEGSPNDDGATVGVRDLNDAGNEYTGAPGQIAIPRFLGQDPLGGAFDSDIIFFTLSKRGLITLDGLVFNDNEISASIQPTFTCWDKRKLRDIDGGFSLTTLNTDLQGTSHAADEIFGLTTRESGWILLDAVPPDDVAFYAVLIERANGLVAATLPFELCSQTGRLQPGP